MSSAVSWCSSSSRWKFLRSNYVLAGFRRRAAISSESSLKYFLLGSFAMRSSCTAWRSFWRHRIHQYCGDRPNLRSGPIPVLAYAGIALMFVGLVLK